MADPTLAAHIDQAAAIVRDLVRLRPRLKLGLPPDLARAKAQLDALRSAGDHNTLLQVGVALSSQQEPLSMGELSKALDVPLSTATRIADWWVKNGYAERSPDAQDRRVVRIALTKPGRDLLKAGNKLICQRVEQVLRRFTPDERETLVVLMRKLVASLENEEE
jgi:DNA-binding MarR family transcriptional regulator